MRRIASRRNAIVARYRDAARGDVEGVMLLDGVHLVQEAIAAGVTIREAAVSADVTAEDGLAPLVARLEAARIDTTAVTAPVLAALSPVRSSSPIVALADRPSGGAAVFGPSAALVIVAVDVQDPGNLGAIVRVAEAGGATGVVVAGRSADPFGWKALRGSMGSALRLPILIKKGPFAVSEFRRGSSRVLATVPRGGQAPDAIDLTRPVAILIGGEGPGLPQAVLAEADERITIPMTHPVESLNTAVTAALIVYEARRQRAAAGVAVRERA